MVKKTRGGGEVNHGVVVVSRVIICRPPMRCAWPRTIDHDRTTPALKDEKATPALSTSGELPKYGLTFSSHLAPAIPQKYFLWLEPRRCKASCSHISTHIIGV